MDGKRNAEQRSKQSVQSEEGGAVESEEEDGRAGEVAAVEDGVVSLDFDC